VWTISPPFTHEGAALPLLTGPPTTGTPSAPALVAHLVYEVVQEVEREIVVAVLDGLLDPLEG
jgi:hypothetical protein